MKFLVYILLLVFVSLLACSKDQDTSGLSDCMTQKIEDFKSEPLASAVIQINTPVRDLYWFRYAALPPDVGEDVFTSDCERFCNFGCFCDPSSWCDENLLSYPRKTIWSK